MGIGIEGSKFGDKVRPNRAQWANVQNKKGGLLTRGACDRGKETSVATLDT